MAELDNILGTVLDEKYRLERLLGKGGMGAVFLATHLGTERPVALKLMAPRLMQNDEFTRRFSREAKAAGRLRHPNVVDVTDFGVARTERGPLAYLVMEYLDGCTLGDILAEEKQLPLEWVADILEQTCSAVHEAHQLGIVHRDLKPDNIWLEPNRFGGYRVKVLDFGLAKLAEATPLSAANVAPALPTNSLPNAATLIEESNAATLEGNALTLEKNAPTVERGLVSLVNKAAHTGMAVDKEAATIALAAPVAADESGEAATQAMSAPAVDGEAATREMAIAVAQQAIGALVKHSDGPTPIVGGRTASGMAHGTALDGNVTRVGSIIGTPLYMSPEQCRGERLGVATDIYSLGVITYQMLAGETPFTGNSLHVIKQHRESQPTPLREKNPKVPRKIARLVMSALAKDPARRPVSAEAFANMLRARAESSGTLIQRGMALYSERFVSLIKVSLLAHLPIILGVALAFLKDGLVKLGVIGKVGNIIFSASTGLIFFAAQLVSAAIITGVTVLIVIQLTVAPLRPVQGRQALRLMRPRIKPMVWVSFLVLVISMLGFGFPFLPIITGLGLMMLFSLHAPVVLIEDLRGLKALQRSGQLVLQAVGMVVVITIVQWLIPAFAGSIFQQLAGGLKHDNAYRTEVAGRLANLLNIFIIPLTSVLNALLYLRVRQAVGEPVKQLPEQLDATEAPTSQWQRRMRERLALSKPSSSGASSL